jgi:hypothetical protein
MAGTVKHVVIMVQENHTTDNYFGALAPWGANVATGWPVEPDPPVHNPWHGRKDYFNWLNGAGSHPSTQFDAAAVLPFYLWLAINGAFLENHCAGYGTNSTPNHMLIVGGQTPTLRNPPSSQPPPVWDLPSLPGLAEDNGMSWRAYCGKTQYPLAFYQQLHGSANILSSDQFAADAAAGHLAEISMMWHDSPYDEHPTADVTLGQGKIWQAVDAVVHAGLWTDTVFLLTWDDWGGWDDHVATPVVEYTPDNVQLAYGPRVPLLIFGGHVKTAIDNRWCSHVSITKTAIQLLGLPALGVDRVDNDGGLADLVDRAAAMPAPPPYGNPVPLPAAPNPPIAAQPLPPPPSTAAILVPEVVLRGGGLMPAPNDQPLPQQPAPPSNAPAVISPQARGGLRRALNVVAAPGSPAWAAYRRAGEEADLPAIAGAAVGGTDPSWDLQNFGGRTIQELSYRIFYLGGAASWQGDDRTNIDAALTTIMQDPGLVGIIGQYFGGKAPTTTVQPSVFLDGAIGPQVFKDQVESLLVSLHQQGQTAGADLANTIFVFALPSGVVLIDGFSGTPPTTEPEAARTNRRAAEVLIHDENADSLHGLGGFHGSVHDGADTLYYAVAVYSEQNGAVTNGIPVFDQPWKNVVATLYHELCEARTDPDVEDVNRAGGGIDSLSLLGWYSTSGKGEIGDLPISLVEDQALPLQTVFVVAAMSDGSSQPVQLQWSNRVDGPEGPPARHSQPG